MNDTTVSLPQIPKEIDALCYKIIGICMNIHTEVGPGFPEEYYQKALEIEFGDSKIPFESQQGVTISYKEIPIGMNYLDFLIEEKLILEIKSVNQLTNIHKFQVLKYIGYTGLDYALLVNFGKESLQHERILPTRKMLDFRQKQTINNTIQNNYTNILKTIK